MSDEKIIHFNGLNITTGQYLTAPMTVAAFAAAAQAQQQPVKPPQPQVAAAGVRGVVRVLPPPHAAAVRSAAAHPLTAAFRPAAVPGFDPTKLEEAGWGVIFAGEPDPAVYDALRPLLDLRRAQASRLKPQRYKEYRGRDGWQPRETADHFLQRHGAKLRHVKPDEVPYYLLLVADPRAIVYGSQANLDMQRAVGRIHFRTPEEYASYARSVVAAETGKSSVPRRAALFGPTNDRNTRMSCKELVRPLARALRADRPTWKIDKITADRAVKATLGQLLGGGDPAALVFTASHGGFTPYGDPVQVKRQGCLICQGFHVKKIGTKSYNPADYYFSGEDIPNSARIPPMITFHFACFGVGTPRHDQFIPDEPSRKSGRARSAKELAPVPFVAYLPQRLLGHPKGGALASIGHVERAWGFTFHAEHKDTVATFRRALLAIMDGKPVGHAMKSFGSRYAQLTAQLAGFRQPQGTSVTDEGTDGDFVIRGQAPSHARREITSDDYVALWTALKDARNYAIVGDPAVRLPLPATR